MRLPTEKCQLKITDQALNKAQAYARLVVDMFGPNECIGFLAGDPNSDVIDTVILSPQQTVSTCLAKIDGQGVLAAGRELEQLGKQPKGWWHSHGSMPPFHSATDDANTRDVLNQIGHLQWTYMIEQLMPKKGTTMGIVRFVNDTNEVIELKVEPTLAAQLTQAEVQARRKVPVSVVYSLVVNAGGDTPYAELHSHAWCKQTQSTQISKQAVPVTVIYPLDEEPLRQEINAKVRLNQPAFILPAVKPTTLAGQDGILQPTIWQRLATPFLFVPNLWGTVRHFWEKAL